MPGRLLHVSDLHTGTREDPETESALGSLIERTEPELIVASGDLTHRGLREQHERAARFLRSFGRPVVAIPGNHDMPYTFPARFTRTYAEFERQWETTEPTVATEAFHVVGLNSSRRWRQQGGALDDGQLRDAASRLGQAADGAYRVVVLHHHMLGAPWRAARKRPVSDRNRVLRALVEAGADLILAGHIHQAAVSERHEFEVVDGEVRAAVVSIAPGLGQPRPNRLGEARGLHVYDVGDDTIAVSTYIWRRGDWGLTAQRIFPRGLGPLAVES
ncbi:MAG TPA: metallophosphoesterase [Gaiellaceae bacterium]|nr:metallophosphoesterase [Gaiellaceae bacterium]